jgi:hypothetical protein
MQWIPFIPKGGGLIKVEIDVHPPIPPTQNMGFHLGSFFTVFWVLKFRGHFEDLNDVVWARQHLDDIQCHFLGQMEYLLRLDLSDEV